jgi:Ca2+-binding RTX toxin-like protein
LDFVLCVVIEGVLSGPPADSEPPLALRATRRSRPGRTSLVGHPDLTQNVGQNPFGGPGVDNITGSEGDDTLWGNFGSDLISGGQGDDFVDGDNPFPPPPGPLPFPPGGNDDTCAGGQGTDAISNCETTSP